LDESVATLCWRFSVFALAWEARFRPPAALCHEFAYWFGVIAFSGRPAAHKAEDEEEEEKEGDEEEKEGDEEKEEEEEEEETAVPAAAEDEDEDEVAEEEDDEEAEAAEVETDATRSSGTTSVLCRGIGVVILISWRRVVIAASVTPAAVSKDRSVTVGEATEVSHG
jgi:hypothetical protein